MLPLPFHPFHWWWLNFASVMKKNTILQILLKASCITALWAIGYLYTSAAFSLNEINSRVMSYWFLIVCIDSIGIYAGKLWYEYPCLLGVIWNIYAYALFMHGIKIDIKYSAN